MHSSRLLKVTVASAAVVLLAAACGSSSGSGSSGSASAGSTQRPAPPSVPMASTVGAGEGQLNLITWAGYAENGSNDPK